MSASSTPTERPFALRASARLAATVDLPTPPLPEATATIARTPGASAGLPAAAAGRAAAPGAGPPCPGAPWAEASGRPPPGRPPAGEAARDPDPPGPAPAPRSGGLRPRPRAALPSRPDSPPTT